MHRKQNKLEGIIYASLYTPWNLYIVFHCNQSKWNSDFLCEPCTELFKLHNRKYLRENHGA